MCGYVLWLKVCMMWRVYVSMGSGVEVVHIWQCVCVCGIVS